MFENIKNYARGHKAGYITEGNTYPERSVQDCNNLDLEEMYDRRRPPYRQISVSGNTNIADIGSEYKRIGLYEKDYLDADGNINTVIMIVMKHEINHSIKIFTNKFYNPDNSYGNNNSEPVGWSDGWTEVTEGYFLTDTDYNWVYQATHLTPLRNEYVIFGTGTKPEYLKNKSEEYFKGWFIYDANHDCIGQITSITNVANVYTIQVAINSITYRDIFTLTNYDSVSIPYSTNVKKITGVSIGTPVTINSNSHGFSNGTVVRIYGLGGTSQITALNGTGYVISNVTTNTFDISANTTGGVYNGNSGLIVAGENLSRIYLVRYPVLDFADLSIVDGRTLQFPTNTITGISKTASAIITTSELHAFNVGDTIYISGVSGMTEMNGINAQVTAAISNQITININSTGFTTYVSGGTVLKYLPKTQFVERASIQDSFNSVKICLGNKVRPIKLTFLQAKRFWNPNTSQHNVTWNGFWMKYDIPLIDNIKSVVKWEDSTGSGDVGLTLFFDNSNQLTIRKIGKELGVRIKYKSITSIQISLVDLEEEWKDVVVGMCITLDGYQTVFLKYFIGSKWYNNTPEPDEYFVYGMYPAFQFMLDFDRSITDTNLFANNPHTTPTISSGDSFQETESFMLISDVGGITELSEATNYQDNIFEIDKHTNNPIYSTFVKLNAIGIPLNSAINSKFYHSPVSAFSIIFKLGEDNMIGIDIGEDYLGTDSKLKDKYGYSKIVLSNLQFRDIDGTPINADSCFGEERIRQLLTGEKIVAGESTINNRFVLFTNKSSYSYRVEDEATGSINTEISKYLLLGTYSQRTIIKARIGDQFAGLYWLAKGKDSIYRMLDNNPQDILENRWRETYRAISESDKDNAVIGFNARTNDLHFVIGSKIFVWNLERENWQIYTFADKPDLYFTDSSGQVIFTSGLNLFRLEPHNTEEFKDQTTSGEAAIPFKLVKEIDYGTEVSEKIFDRMNVEFEKALDDAVAINPITFKVGQDGDENNLLDEIVNINNLKQYHRVNKLLRTSSAKHRVEFNYSDSSGGIKKFTLKEMLILSKLKARRLSP